MPLNAYSMVSFDVDGTIFRKAALTTAAKALGIGERWDTYDKMYHMQRISLKECLDQQFKLLSGMPIVDVLREISKVEAIRNIRETVVKLQGHGLGVTLLTDNPDFLCSYLVESYGFNGYIASKVEVKDGILTGKNEPLADKAEGLKKYCEWMGLVPRKCIHVGDWVNDIPVFKIVGYSVALNPKTQKVRDRASVSIETPDLLEVYQHLASLS